MSGVSLYQTVVATFPFWSFSSCAMTVPSVSNRMVPRLTGGLFVVRVHCDAAGTVSTTFDGLAVTKGTRIPSAQGKTGLAFTVGIVAVLETCATDEKVSNELASTAANDNETVLWLCIVRFYSTHSPKVNWNLIHGRNVIKTILKTTRQ